MKTILIEQVANGWLVRGRSAWYCQSEYTHVYTSAEEMLKDLPRLINDSWPAEIPEPTHLTRHEKA